MRPTRLELAGFASFREPTTLDFEGAELFVLSGATGAGKCVPGWVRVYDPVEGEAVPIEQFVREERKRVLGVVGSRIVPVDVTDWHELGSRPTVEVQLTNGDVFEVATTHPILTDRGLTPAADLDPSHWVGQARRLPACAPGRVTRDEAFLIGLLLGDGTLTTTVALTATDPAVAAAFRDAVQRTFPVVDVATYDRRTHVIRNPLRGEDRRAYIRALAERISTVVALDAVLGSNVARFHRGDAAPSFDTLLAIEESTGLDLYQARCTLHAPATVRHWARSLGFLGTRAETKCVPGSLLLQPDDVVGAMLSGLFTADGHVDRRNMVFGSVSHQLAADVRILCRRLGLATTWTTKDLPTGRTFYRVRVTRASQIQAAKHLTLPGVKGRRLAQLVAEYENTSRKHLADRLPPSFLDDLPYESPDGRHRRTAKQRAEHGMSRELYLAFGGDPSIADSDIAWSPVSEVRATGRRVPCFDITVDTDEHLYVTDTVIGHNSSIVDSIVFALYGSVPRYDDRRLVAPVISTGRNEARVRLDFSVGDEDYSAVRVVRRTARGGATTKEARLERCRDGVTLAGTADELTAAVTRLLGLSFDHFTKTVVLPQGDFQEFLHAKPKDRQDLLVELLDLDVYRRVAARARDREATVRAEAELLTSRLEGDLAGATPEAVAAARARADRLGALIEELDAARPELERVVEAGREARVAAKDAQGQLDALRTLRTPQEVADLSERLRSATERLDAGDREVAAAEQAREEHEKRRAELPDVAPLHRARDLLQARTASRERIAGAREEAATAREEAGRRQAGVEQAQSTLERAIEALERLRHTHAAHAVAADLEVGAPCPVCQQPVEQLPRLGAPPGLEDAEHQVQAAQQQLADATRSVQEAQQAAAVAQERLTAAEADRDEVDRRLAELREQEVPTEAEALAEAMEAVQAADGALHEATQAERAARATQRRAREALQALDAERDRAWRTFDEARDRVAALGPPHPDREDLAGSWDRLTRWAAEQAPAAERRSAEAARRIEAAERDYRARVGALRARAQAAEVALDPAGGTFEALRDAVTDAASRARAHHEQLAGRLEEATDARERRDTAKQHATLAKALGHHLNARNFEKWLLNRALRRLVTGASTILQELSSGAYSLAIGDDNAFLVIDHRNADEQRSARTLSGGETFLASLALALALAEDVAALATHGSARLDALFLDEGFGTLDAETLDVVAAAIEELGAQGRMVGLITHVRDLAERIPVRYEVRRSPGTSTVEKVLR